MSQENEKKRTSQTTGGKRRRKSGGSMWSRLKQKPAKKTDAPQRTGKAQVLHILYIVLTVISAIIVVGYIFWKIFAAPPAVDSNDPNRPTATRPPVVITTTDPITGEQIEVEIPALSADRKDQYYTFLMVGVSQDTGGGLTDTMMLASYDVPNQKLNIMSLPRDTYVSGTQLLNSVYVAGGGDKDGKGIEALKKAVQKLTGVYPDFHAVIQWEALGELVDAIGGVEFEVPFDMYYNDKSQNFKIDLKKGLQTLDGEGAMGLVRWRMNSKGDTGIQDYSYGYAEGDIGRIKTQQAFLKEVIKKCLRPEVLLTNLAEYIGIFQENVVTNLSVGEMAYFAQSAVGGLDMDNVGFFTLPYLDAGNGHLLPSGSKIVSIVNANFNPYEEDIHLGELKLTTMDDLPKTSKAPEESVDPDESPDPDGSPAPEESRRPDESEDPDESESPETGDPVLPPGVLVRPSQSPKPTASAKPSGSPSPTESADPDDAPKPTETPGAQPEDTPQPSREPEPTPSPAPTPDEEPLLPPGV